MSEDREEWRRTDTAYAHGVLTIKVTPASDSVWFAYFAPYTMERHHDLVAAVAAASGGRLSLARPDARRARDGLFPARRRAAPGLALCAPASRRDDGRMVDGGRARAAARRRRPGDPRACARSATFHIVPNMNPDGSFRGHLRTNAVGTNLNREWHEPSLEKSPEVLRVRAEMDRTGVDFAMDVHGDEAIAANFLAGFEGHSALERGAAGPLRRLRRRAGPRPRPISRPPRAMRLPAPGQANLSMSTAQLAERFGAVSMTLEMPFKDNEDLPDPDLRLVARPLAPARPRLPRRAPRDHRRGSKPRKQLMPTLVLIRHGQSAWNLENRFTGWWDVDLTAQGEAEAKAAGELLAAQGHRFRPLLHQRPDPRDQDAAHRARGDGPAVAARGEGLAAQRAPLWRPHRPRQGRDRGEARRRAGPDLAPLVRHAAAAAGSRAAPSTSPADRRYAGIAVPATESLKDTIARVLPYWEERIAPALARRPARADLRPRQFAARAGQASLGHSRRRDHRRSKSRPASRSSTSWTRS